MNFCSDKTMYSCFTGIYDITKITGYYIIINGNRVPSSAY